MRIFVGGCFQAAVRLCENDGSELPTQAHVCRAFVAVSAVFIHAVEVHIQVVGDVVAGAHGEGDIGAMP